MPKWLYTTHTVLTDGCPIVYWHGLVMFSLFMHSIRDRRCRAAGRWRRRRGRRKSSARNKRGAYLTYYSLYVTIITNKPTNQPPHSIMLSREARNFSRARSLTINLFIPSWWIRLRRIELASGTIPSITDWRSFGRPVSWIDTTGDRASQRYSFSPSSVDGVFSSSFKTPGSYCYSISNRNNLERVAIRHLCNLALATASFRLWQPSVRWTVPAICA